MCQFCVQTYTRRKAAKEREKQSEGVQHSDKDSKTGRETTKMALPQFEREKKNYTPSKCHLKYSHNTLSYSTVKLQPYFCMWLRWLNCIYSCMCFLWKQVMTYTLVYVRVKNSGHTCTVPLKSAVNLLTCLILPLIQNQSQTFNW